MYYVIKRITHEKQYGHFDLVLKEELGADIRTTQIIKLQISNSGMHQQRIYVKEVDK